MSVAPSTIDRAGSFVAAWVVEQLRMRAIVRRPWAVIEGKVVTRDVVYHDPDAMV